ncbi:hypothetical protein HZS_6408, partial [Henneguya salminicola]
MALGYFSTEHIAVTSDGSWKLCSLDFLFQSNAVFYFYLTEKNEWIKNFSHEQIQKKLINLLKTGISSPDPTIQIVSLDILQKNINIELISNESASLYSGLKDLSLKSTILNVQVNSIICLSKILKYLKSQFCVNDLISDFCSISTINSAVALSILGIFQNILKYAEKKIDSKIVALELVPYLLKNTQTIEFNQNQLEMYFKIIDKFIALIKEKTISHKETINKGMPSINLPTVFQVATLKPEIKNFDLIDYIPKPSTLSSTVLSATNSASSYDTNLIDNALSGWKSSPMPPDQLTSESYSKINKIYKPNYSALSELRSDTIFQNSTQPIDNYNMNPIISVAQSQ